MESHDQRDLDGIIDEVARAMTSMELARDLRPAVASRIASPAPWTLGRQHGWRFGVAATIVAGVVMLAVVLRPTPEPQTASDAGVRAAVVAPMAPSGDTAALVAAEGQAIRRMARPVARQTVVDTAPLAETVDISPVAIVPLEEDDEDVVLTSSHVVEIALIDVEPVSIGEIELVE